jgi:RNA polymerase sporulation-specific sigma factor
MSILLALFNELRFLIGHISDKSVFPKPLSRTEEKSLLEKYRQGNGEAFDKLVEHNMRLVAHIAKKYTQDKLEFDDLISIGSIGLIKAIRSFDEKKCIHLATYASRCIDNEILMYLRSAKKLKNEVSLMEPVGVDKEGNEVSLIDILKSNDVEVDENVDTKLQIRHMLEKMNAVLDEREKKVMILRYGLGGRRALTQRETAKQLKISRSYVSRIEKAAFNKIKSGLCADFHI